MLHSVERGKKEGKKNTHKASASQARLQVLHSSLRTSAIWNRVEQGYQQPGRNASAISSSSNFKNEKPLITEGCFHNERVNEPYNQLLDRISSKHSYFVSINICKNPLTTEETTDQIS